MLRLCMTRCATLMTAPAAGACPVRLAGAAAARGGQRAAVGVARLSSYGASLLPKLIVVILIVVILLPAAGRQRERQAARGKQP